MKAEKKNKACSNIVVTLTMFPLKSMLGNFLLTPLMAGKFTSTLSCGGPFSSIQCGSSTMYNGSYKWPPMSDSSITQQKCPPKSVKHAYIKR